MRVGNQQVATFRTFLKVFFTNPEMEVVLPSLCHWQDPFQGVLKVEVIAETLQALRLFVCSLYSSEMPRSRWAIIDEGLSITIYDYIAVLVAVLQENLFLSVNNLKVDNEPSNTSKVRRQRPQRPLPLPQLKVFSRSFPCLHLFPGLPPCLALHPARQADIAECIRSLGALDLLEAGALGKEVKRSDASGGERLAAAASGGFWCFFWLAGNFGV